MERFANVFNSGVSWKFIMADHVNFSVEIIKIFLGTVISSVASFVQKFAVELEAGGQGFLGEGQGEVDFVLHALIMAHFGTEVKGVNRPAEGGKPP